MLLMIQVHSFFFTSFFFNQFFFLGGAHIYFVARAENGVENNFRMFQLTSTGDSGNMFLDINAISPETKKEFLNAFIEHSLLIEGFPLAGISRLPVSNAFDLLVLER
jgi:hypothetical protein